MGIASRMLGHELEGKKRMFFNFRHTGASHIAQRGKTPAHLLAVVKMMGDTSVQTGRRSHRQSFSAHTRRQSAARR